MDNKNQTPGTGAGDTINLEGYTNNDGSVDSSDLKNSVQIPGQHQPGMGRTQADYTRQQEDIRANQVFGESSLDRGSDRQHHTERPAHGIGGQDERTSEERERGQGVQPGSGKPYEDDVIAPKNDKGYDISPTATNVRI